MDFKKAISVAMLMAIGFTQQSFAAYPSSSGVYGGDERDVIRVVGDDVNNDVNPSDVFSVDGMDFVLLDTDEEGNYFVTTASHIGKYKFYQYTDTEFAEAAILREKYNDDVTDNFDGVTDVVKYDEWKFSTTNENSIGYWLNNEFLEEGYTWEGNHYVLPQSIKDYLLEREWEVESTALITPANIDTVLGGSGMDLSDLDEMKSFYTYPAYTVTGKISMISYSEYLQYYDKLGFDFDGLPAANYQDSFMFRTGYVGINPTNTDGRYQLTVIRGPVTIQNNAGETKMITSGRFVGWSPYPIYYTRPVFWLSKDFFGEVKFDLSSIGERPLNEIKKQGIDKLGDLYNDDELSMLGIDVSKIPSAGNVKITGTPSAGALVNCVYDYVSPENNEEQGTEYLWYASDAIDGEYVQVAETASAGYVIPKDIAQKYLKVYVRPIDADGNIGRTNRECIPVEILPENDLSVLRAEIKDGAVVAEIFNNSQSDKEVRIIALSFDENGVLCGMNSAVADIKAGESQNIESELPQGSSYQLMVMENLSNRPIYYLNKQS